MSERERHGRRERETGFRLVALASLFLFGSSVFTSPVAACHDDAPGHHRSTPTQASSMSMDGSSARGPEAAGAGLVRAPKDCCTVHCASRAGAALSLSATVEIAPVPPGAPETVFAPAADPAPRISPFLLPFAIPPPFSA